jgi:hypothetical protein
MYLNHSRSLHDCVYEYTRQRRSCKNPLEQRHERLVQGECEGRAKCHVGTTTRSNETVPS